MYMYLFPVFILVNEINRQITTSEIYLLKRETPLSLNICSYKPP